MPTQTLPSLEDLLRVLCRATEKNSITWTPTAEDDTFRAQLGRGMVRLAKAPEEAGYSLALLDEEGMLLDEYHPAEPDEREGIAYLYSHARRKALNLDLKLRNLYDHLKSLAGES